MVGVGGDMGEEGLAEGRGWVTAAQGTRQLEPERTRSREENRGLARREDKLASVQAHSELDVDTLQKKMQDFQVAKAQAVTEQAAVGDRQDVLVEQSEPVVNDEVALSEYLAHQSWQVADMANEIDAMSVELGRDAGQRRAEAKHGKDALRESHRRAARTLKVVRREAALAAAQAPAPQPVAMTTLLDSYRLRRSYGSRLARPSRGRRSASSR